MDIKYPKIKVKLTHRDGNAFAILGKMREAFCKHKLPKEEIDNFMKESMSGDYDHLLRTCIAWVNIS